MVTWDKYCKEYIQEAKKLEHTDDYIEKNLSYAKKIFDQNLPIIYDINHFSKLVGIDKALITSMGYSSQSFYRTFFIQKASGKKRKIHEPLPMLKEIQIWILNNILYKIKVSPFAKAYIPKKSIKDNVRFHKGQEIILKLDVQDFFSNIKYVQILSFFKMIGYEKNLAALLSNLVVLEGCLPQGAPTSPCLSNIMMRKFDDDISYYCKKKSLRYTRYADDLTFSGDLNKQRIINLCKKKLRENGLSLNEEKTRLLKKHNRQCVTGIVVNEKMQVDRSKRLEYRKITYYIGKYGVENHLKKLKMDIQPEHYLISLRGKVEYAIFINPYDEKLKKCLKIIEDALLKIDIS